MIKQQDLFNIRFYEKSPFFGSYCGMHYRISRTDDGGETKLEAVTWPGPYNYATTDDNLKERAVFEFSDEGLAEVCRYLNETRKKGRPK